jgi:uncharacterized protein YlxP (DUF503 family)
MWTGTLEVDLLLGDVHSLKEKRSVVRPIIAEVKRRYQLSVAEVGHQGLYRRTAVGVAVVAADRAHVVEVLDEVERMLVGRPDTEPLSVRRRLISSDDD